MVPWFNSRPANVFQASEIPEIISELYLQLIGQIENPALLRSGFVLNKILFEDVIISQNLLTPGGSYITLPKEISSRNATINPKNEDDRCFMWAIIVALHRDDIGVHPERISKIRKYVDNYDWRDTFPVHPRDIKIWEEKNNIRVNVLGHSGSDIYIIKNDGNSYSTTVDLFLISDGENSHYVTNTDIEKLLSSDVNPIKPGLFEICQTLGGGAESTHTL